MKYPIEERLAFLYAGWIALSLEPHKNFKLLGKIESQVGAIFCTQQCSAVSQGWQKILHGR